MRKFLFISLCITILCLFCSLPVNAQELNRKIGEGYTAEGIHYTVYEAETTQTHTRSVEPSIYVSRYFVFDSTYFPPQKIKHQEIIYGFYYVGTLTRFSVNSDGNQVTANYRGTLYLTTTNS